MNKARLIDYLNKQLNADSGFISFNNFKNEIISFLNKIFGEKNNYSKTLENIQAVTTESLEELYPKTIIDEVASIKQFKSTLFQIIAQIDLMETDTITIQNDNNAFKIIINDAVQKYFSDLEIEEISKIVNNNKPDKEELLSHLRQIESEKRLYLLTEILFDKNLFSA